MAEPIRLPTTLNGCHALIRRLLAEQTSATTAPVEQCCRRCADLTDGDIVGKELERRAHIKAKAMVLAYTPAEIERMDEERRAA